jgi:hypothetical protein
MAGCDTFVSLLRSCYRTKARFFRDDLAVVNDVEWYFTSPDAQWCGRSNIFNARTWYGGTIGWPELGEIEGAARTWVRGDNRPTRHAGVQGSPEQWEEGTVKADAVLQSPCEGIITAIDVPFPERGGTMVLGADPLHPRTLIQLDSDTWYFFEPVVINSYVVVRRTPGGPVCGFPSPGQFFWGLPDPHNAGGVASFQFVVGVCQTYAVFTIAQQGYEYKPTPLI